MFDFFIAAYHIILAGFVMIFSVLAIPLLYTAYVLGGVSVVLAIVWAFRLFLRKTNSPRIIVLMAVCAIVSFSLFVCFRVLFGPWK